MTQDLVSSETEARPRQKLTLAPEPICITVEAKNEGRITGHLVNCPEHGDMPKLAPSKNIAVRVAADHVRLSHNGKGWIGLK